MTAADPGRRFAFDVDFFGVPVATWDYTFEETETGYTCLAQYVARAIALGAFGKSLRRDDKEE